MKPAAKTGMTAAEEKTFDAKAENHFRRQREIPKGRDYRWDTYRFDQVGHRGGRPRDRIDQNFHTVFPGSPGSPAWFDKKFAQKRKP